MNRFSRISHHVSVKEVKQRRLEKLAEKKLEEKKIEEEKKFLVSAMNHARYDWRQKIDSNYIMREGMTTSSMYVDTLPAEGETAIDQLPPTDAASFADVNNMFGAGADSSALDGTTVRANGTGSGSNGGFNVGGEYLAFQGDGTAASRFALMKPLDATKIDTLTITAIRGNGSNGGEEADIVGQEELFVIYKTPDMTRSSYLSQDRNQNNIGAFPADAAIIAIGQGDGTLQDYTITIPEYARQKDTVFGLFQLSHSGAGFDHYGVTDIKFQRKAPVNIVVPLDDPEAISFISVGTDEGDPKKRKKKVNDQLAASDEYTASQMGGEFPGQGGRIDGEDPFKSAEIQDVAAPSPIGKPAVKRTFQDFKNLTDQQRVNQSNEYLDDYIKTFSDGTYNDPESLEILDRAIEINPKNVDAYFYRSFAYFDNQNYDDALADTERILEIDPNNSDISYMRAIIYKEKGDLELSLEEIEKSLETNPDDSYLKDMKAEVEGQIEQEYRAKQVPPDADEEGGVVKRQTYYDEVSKKLAPEDTEDEQLVSTNLAQAKDLMSSTHYSFGRDGVFSKGAIELLQDAYAVEPNNPEILSNLGVALLMGGKAFDGKGGVHYLERAQALDPSIKFDFGIKSWDRYDGEEEQPFAGAKIERLGSLPYRYAREIIKNLPDQSTAKGAKHGATRPDYAEKYGGSYSKFYTDKAKSYSTRVLQSQLVSAARKIEDNKYWMNNLGNHPTFKGNDDIIGVPGYVLGATKWTGALTGKTMEDYYREKEKMDNWPTDEYGYYKAGWREQNEKVNKTLFQVRADDRSKGVSAGVKQDIEKYKAYYDEYMRRGEPDAIEKIDVPEAGKFIETAQKEIIEKAVSEPAKLFKLTAAEEKSYQMALELTGTNSVGYTAALPFALGTSILTGKPQQLFIAPSSAIKIAQDINADELAKVLRIDNPVPVTARETIQPSEGKTKEVITSLFGSQGGLQFNYDTETKQLYIEARKTLRTTSGGEEVQNFGNAITGTVGGQTFNPLFRLPKATGTGTKFTDIPVPTKDEVNGKISKIYLDIFTKYTEYQDFIDPVVKSGFNPIKIANVIFDGLRGKIQKTSDRQPSLMQEFNPDAPREWDPELGKSVNNYDVSIAALKQSLDQSLLADIVVTLATKYVEVQTNAIAANLVALRKIMTDIGIPASDIEKFGGAIGMVYSSTPVNFDDLPDEVKKVIEAAVGSPQGKPKPKPESEPRSGLAGLDEPIVFDKDKKKNKKNNIKEQTLFKRVKPKPFFNPKDIKPTFPEKPPGKIDPKTGMHQNYGKQAGRYKRLDPISANAMPKTGDPEIDAMVDKQRTKEIPSKRREKYIKKVAEQKKYSWRQDFIKESEWRPVTGAGPTNATSQTFGYFDGGGNPVVNSQTGQQVTTTASGLGGVEATSSTTTIDLGFGETLNVSSPTYDQLALAGVAKPIVMKRKETDDTNKKLDASQEFAQKVGADYMMNARVQDAEKEVREKAKKLEKLKKRISELNKLAAQQSKKISKMRDDGLKKISEKYDERNKVRDNMVRKFEASFPSLTYNAMGNMVIKDKADSDRYYKTEGDFYKKVDATWDSMTKKIDAERKAFLEKMDKLYNSTVGKYNQEEFNLTNYELPDAEAEYKDALNNYGKAFQENQFELENMFLQIKAFEKFLDMIADKVGVGISKSMFDFYVGDWMKNPTNERMNLNNIFKPHLNTLKGYMSDIESQIKLGKIVGDSPDQIQRSINDYWNNVISPKMPTDLRNSLGNGSRPNYKQWLKTGNWEVDKEFVFTELNDFQGRFGGGFLGLLAKHAPQVYAVYKSVLGGNFGNLKKWVNKPMKYKVILDGNKTKSTNKTINKIKSMSKERAARKALSLDEPIVTSSKSKRKNKKG